MSFRPNKHPKDMTLSELYQSFMDMQKAAKAQGQNVPLFMDNQPPTPDKAGLPNFHVPSVRGLLETAYNQQNPTPAKPQGQQMAMAGIVDATSTVRDGVLLHSQVKKAQHERNQETMQNFINWGMLPSDFAERLKKNPDGLTGDKKELEDIYKEKYLEYERNKKK